MIIIYLSITMNKLSLQTQQAKSPLPQPNSNQNSIPQQSHPQVLNKQSEKPQEKVKNKGRLITIAMIISLPSVYYGFTLTFLSTLPKKLLAQFYGPQIITNSSILPILTGAMPVGAILGSLLANIIMRYLTRKNYLIVMNIAALIVNLIIQITNLWVLLFSRLATGILVGLYLGIIPKYINQICPPSVSGSIGTFTQLQHLIGNVVSYFFGMIFYLCDYEGQFMMRFQYEFSSILMIVQLGAFWVGFVPESPNSLLNGGKMEEAREVLRRFNSQEDVQKLIHEKLLEIGQNKKAQKSVELATYNKNQEKTIQSPLVKQDPTTPIVNPIKIKEQQQLQMNWKSYFLSFELPLTQQFTGVNFIVTQMTAITAIYDQSLSHFTALIANVVQLIGTALSAYVFSRLGRRAIILFGNYFIGGLLIVLGVVFLELYRHWNPGFALGMTLIMIFNLVFGLTLGPAVWLYIPEIALEKVVPLATATYWCGCSICVIVAPIVTSLMGTPYAVFFFLGAYMLVMGVPNWFLVVETKGLVPSEINKKFKQI